MIYSVHGTLLAKELSLAVVECGGVGYACRTTFTTLSQLGNVGETVFLYTALSVREDAVELFGFATKQELQCFRLLTTVSGVGPKAALAILSDLPPDRFLLTVAAGDSKQLTRSKGIGAKTAQRIVMELKDKIALFCNVPSDHVLQNLDVEYLYEAPLSMEKEHLATGDAGLYTGGGCARCGEAGSVPLLFGDDSPDTSGVRQETLVKSVQKGA